MVTIEISQIIYGVFSVGLVIMGFLVVRTLKQNDDRHDQHDTEIKTVRSDLDRLLGEHDSIKDQCRKRKK